jgi:hypothetical protein
VIQTWSLSDRAAPEPRAIADRHYNRQKPGTRQFVPPGRCVVLFQPRAFWVTSWPFAEYVKHAWPGAWVCSAFRNEGAGLSSDLITQAVAATRSKWTPPELEFPIITFIDESKTRPKRDPGYCYLMAGWEVIGRTKGDLLALGQRLESMPEAAAPLGMTLELAV